MLAHAARRAGAASRGFVLTALAAMTLPVGCRSYTPAPVDVGATRQALIDRTIDSPDVAAFVATLDAANPTAPARFDPSDGLSVAEAELVALVYNPDLRLARSRAGVAKATADTAGLWDDPTLNVDLTRILASVPNHWKIFTPVGITLPISGRLEAEKKRAGAALAADLVRVQQQEWQTRIAVRRAWAEWTANRETVEVTREFLLRLDAIVAIVDRMESAGEMPRVEARLFRIERTTRLAELRQVEAAVAEGELRIKHLIGVAPSAAVDLVAGPMAPPSPDSVESLRTQLVERSPALALAKAEHEVAEKALATQIREQYPDLTIAPGYGNEEGDDEVLFGISLPLPLWNRNQQGVAIAEAEREALRVEFDAVYARVVSELETAEVRYRAAVARRLTFEQELVPMVDQQYVEARRIAELGEVNTLVLLQTLTSQQEAKMRLIVVRNEEWQAAIRLDELVGPVTPVRGEQVESQQVESQEGESTS